MRTRNWSALSPYATAAVLLLVQPITTNLWSSDIQDWYQIHRWWLNSLVVAGCVTWAIFQRQHARSALKQEFALFTESIQLLPEHFNFAQTARGVSLRHLSQPTLRPFVPGVYVSRVMEYFDSKKRALRPLAFNERDLRSLIAEGESILIVGQPTEGKSRTMYETLRGLDGYLVVSPPRGGNPSDKALELLRGRKVVCLVDDVNQSMLFDIDVVGFYNKVARSAGQTSLFASCRSGLELAALRRDMAKSPMQSLYEGLEYVLRLRPATEEEMDHLRQELGVSANRRTFPTLGAISMVESFDIMYRRFEALPVDVRAAMWGLQLLSAHGIEPIRRKTLNVVLNHVFGQPAPNNSLNEALGTLHENSFIRSSLHDEAVLPEPAYVAGPEAERYYCDGEKRPGDDRSSLRAALFAQSHAPDLLLMADWYWAEGEHVDAFELWQEIFRAFRSNQDDSLKKCAAEAKIETGLAFVRLEMPNEAIVCFKTVFAEFGSDRSDLLHEPVARALYEEGLTLGEIDRLALAVDAFDRLLDAFSGYESPEIRAHCAMGQLNRGVAYGTAGNHKVALQDFDSVVSEYANDKSVKARKAVNRSRTNRAGAICELVGSEAAASECDALFLSLKDSADEGAREQAARALLLKAQFTRKTQLSEATSRDDLIARELECYQSVRETFKSEVDPGVRYRVADAILGEARIQLEKGEVDAATQRLKELISSYQGDTKVETRCAVAVAMSDLGQSAANQGDASTAIVWLDRVYAKFGKQHAPSVRAIVVKALGRKALILSSQSKDAARDGWQFIVDTYGGDNDAEVREIVFGARTALLLAS
jgi:tetratricopeptide (TPR) repeat protein